MTTALTAAEAFDRYQYAFEHDALTQGIWHKEFEGRHLACGLGVLGDEVTSPGKCPAQVMPRGLARQMVWFFDGQQFDDAKAWGLRFYAEIKRLNGAVPFSVIHDWQANVVGPLAIEVATKRKRNVAAHEALQKMQIEALAGKKFTAEEWHPVLKAAFFDAYADAYADANSYADADAQGAAVKRLADGMIECLARVPSPTDQ